MLPKLLSATAVALVASGLVSAQTSSLCNPVKGQSMFILDTVNTALFGGPRSLTSLAECPADKAAPEQVTIDFTKGASDFFTLADGTTLSYDAQNGAIFKIEAETNAPTITSKQYIFFGKVDVWLKASYGTGIVTSFVLQSDDLDEIDWEWLGSDNTQVQTNYFSKGDDSTYDRGGFSGVGNPQNEWHKYTIDWTNSSLTWLIDDAPVRVLTYADAKGGSTYPQTPMQIKLGTWVAGRKDAPEGTVQWAGGYTDFSQAPFIGYYKQLNVINYSNGVKGATEYVYGDTSGSFESIIVKRGASSGDDTPSTTSSSSQASLSTKTSSSSSSHKTSHSSAVTTASSNASTTSVASSAAVTQSNVTATAATSTVASTPATVPTNAAGSLAVNLGMGAALLVGSLVL